jgi:uncharacterized protein YutD
MIYEHDTLRKMAQELLNSEVATYYFQNMKENWHGFSVEEKKRTIMLDNLRAVLTDRVFNVVSGTYLEIGSRKGIYADLSGEIELKELFDNTETYLCEGCELGICLFTLVRAENKYKLDFSEADPIYNSFSSGGSSRERLLKLFTEKELKELEGSFEGSVSYIYEDRYDSYDEYLSVRACINDLNYHYTSDDRFIITNLVFFEHLKINNQTAAKFL